MILNHMFVSGPPKPPVEEPDEQWKPGNGLDSEEPTEGD